MTHGQQYMAISIVWSIKGQCNIGEQLFVQENWILGITEYFCHFSKYLFSDGILKYSGLRMS
jgi:hypothetical protein